MRLLLSAGLPGAVLFISYSTTVWLIIDIFREISGQEVGQSKMLGIVVWALAALVARGIGGVWGRSVWPLSRFRLWSSGLTVAMQLLREPKQYFGILTLILAVVIGGQKGSGPVLIFALVPLLLNLSRFSKMRNLVWSLGNRPVGPSLLRPWVLAHLGLGLVFILPLLLLRACSPLEALASLVTVALGASVALEGDSGTGGLVHLAACGIGLLSGLLVLASPAFLVFLAYAYFRIEGLCEQRLSSAPPWSQVLDDALV